MAVTHYRRTSEAPQVNSFHVTIIAITSTLLMICFGIAWDAANMRAHRADQQIIDLYATIQKLKDNDPHEMRPTRL